MGRVPIARRPVRPAPPRWVLAVWLLATAAVSKGGGCDDTTRSEPGAVTIDGIVRDFQHTTPAPGIGVTQHGTGHRDEIPTGTDGRYVIVLPESSELRLTTDDFAPADDVWFPVINLDVPATIAAGDMRLWPLHAFRREPCRPEERLYGLWTEYLASWDDQHNGDMFVPESPDASAGVIVLLFRDSRSRTCISLSGLTVGIDAPEFPVGYVNPVGFDCDQPDLVHPPSRTTTDRGGAVVSFGDPAFTGTEITITVTDTDAERDLVWEPRTVPVVRATATLVWFLAIEGVPGASVAEHGCETRVFTVECDEWGRIPWR